MYRFFEILPGTLAWLTLILMVALSWRVPTVVAVFIILFDIYWLLKTIYLSFHLRATFSAMKKNLKVNWLEKLRELKCDPKNPNSIRIPRSIQKPYRIGTSEFGSDIRRIRIVEKELSYRLTGIFFRIHGRLGRFYRERQYGDMLEEELKNEKIEFRREVSISVGGRKSNFIDFVIENRIAVELKVKSFITKEDYYQVQRYLQSANLELGLIVNFAQPHLKPKRVLNPLLQVENSEHSDAFVDWDCIYHLVILPMYREPYEVVRESFESIAKANYPKEKFVVVLATEERAAPEAQITAKKIEREFGREFFKFLITVHPKNLLGEIPGKGSNETWAAKEVKRLIIDPLIKMQSEKSKFHPNAPNSPDSDVPIWQGYSDTSDVPFGKAFGYENILVSVFDIDTQVPPEYFSRLTYVFLKAENRLRAIYQPIPLYTNNIYQASIFSRVISYSNTFWHMMQQARPERLRSYSSQSLPFQVVVDVGFWNTDIVSEDSRIFFQGFLRYHGDFRTEPMNFPVYMDANVAPTFWQTMKNLYKQLRRWGWGVENIPYMLDGFRKDPQIPSRKKWYWSLTEIEGFHSWATNSLLIFALGWLPVFLGGRHFNYSLLSYNLPQITRFIIELSMIGIASSAIISILLLPPRPQWVKRSHYIFYFLQWLLLPITLIVFGAIPGLEAQTRLMLGGKFRLGFWVTPKTWSNPKTEGGVPPSSCRTLAGRREE